MAAPSLFRKIVNTAKKNNQFAFVLKEDDNIYSTKTYTDTGCYALNAFLSNGDIYNGLIDGKRVMISGEKSTAKSLFTAYIIAQYLKTHPNSYAVFFETEGSTVKEMCTSVGIPEDRIVIIPVATVEDLNTQMSSLLEIIIEGKGLNKPTKKGKKGKKEKESDKKEKETSNDKFIFCVDSVGMLGTRKEYTDVVSGNDKKDLTRAQLLKQFSRVISLNLSLTQVPLILVNHIYKTLDMYSPDQIAGGSGPAYMADVSIVVSKTKEKDGSKNHIGANIRLFLEKSRFMIEGKSINILLHFKKGLYKFSSLVDLAYELNVLKKAKNSFLFPDGSTVAMKTVRSKASKYLTKDVLDLLREAMLSEFSFGKITQDESLTDEDVENDIDDDEEIDDDTIDDDEEIDDDTIDDDEEIEIDDIFESSENSTE